MKKLMILLLSFTFLQACGSDGGQGSNNPPNPDPDPDPTPITGISITCVDFVGLELTSDCAGDTPSGGTIIGDTPVYDFGTVVRRDSTGSPVPVKLSLRVENTTHDRYVFAVAWVNTPCGDSPAWFIYRFRSLAVPAGDGKYTITFSEGHYHIGETCIHSAPLGQHSMTIILYNNDAWQNVAGEITGTQIQRIDGTFTLTE